MSGRNSISCLGGVFGGATRRNQYLRQSKGGATDNLRLISKPYFSQSMAFGGFILQKEGCWHVLYLVSRRDRSFPAYIESSSYLDSG